MDELEEERFLDALGRAGDCPVWWILAQTDCLSSLAICLDLPHERHFLRTSQGRTEIVSEFADQIPELSLPNLRELTLDFSTSAKISILNQLNKGKQECPCSNINKLLNNHSSLKKVSLSLTRMCSKAFADVPPQGSISLKALRVNLGAGHRVMEVAQDCRDLAFRIAFFSIQAQANQHATDMASAVRSYSAAMTSPEALRLIRPNVLADNLVLSRFRKVSSMFAYDCSSNSIMELPRPRYWNSKECVDLRNHWDDRKCIDLGKRMDYWQKAYRDDSGDFMT